MQRLLIALLVGMRREAHVLGELLPLGVAAVLLTGLAMTSGSALALFTSQVSPVDTPTATPTSPPTAAAPTETPTSAPAGPTPTPGPIEATPTPVSTSPTSEVPPTATPLPSTPAPTRPPRPTATPTPPPSFSLGNLGPRTQLLIAVIAFGGAAILLLLFFLVRGWKPRMEKAPHAESTAGTEQEPDDTD